MNIRKRYSEFDEFRGRLIRTFPNFEAAVPELPPKSVISKFRPSFLSKRRAGLQYFLKYVYRGPWPWYLLLYRRTRLTLVTQLHFVEPGVLRVSRPQGVPIFMNGDHDSTYDISLNQQLIYHASRWAVFTGAHLML